jgi:hypothetical protein
MRRSIVPLLLLAAAATIWALAMSGPATAARRSPHIICPLRTPRAVPPCCPVPTSGAHGGADAQVLCCSPTPCCGTAPCCQTATCCQPAACCPSGTCCTTPCGPGSLSIAASPNPSTARRKVVISGVLSASPAGGAQVALWRELASQSGYHQVAQTTTDGAGHYTFTLSGATVMADQSLYVTSPGLRSVTVDERVRALVGLTSSARSTTVGQPVVLRGHVTPSHTGQAVLVEQRHGGGWLLIGRARLAAGSSYTLSHRFAQAGSIELRAVLPADARNTRSFSPTVTLAVRQ